MACSCTDLLDDLSDKFDLIIELIEFIALHISPTGVGVYRSDRLGDILREDEEILEMIVIITDGGFLDQ